jgi:ankyrin repeat protein
VSLIKWRAYYGDVSAIKHLIANGASLADLGDNYDLNGAAFHGHWQLCQFLLGQGADVHHEEPDSGETALHSALCKANRPAYNLVVQVLLSHGADPNGRTKPGMPTGGFMRDVFTKQETPLHRAAAFGDAACIEILLEAGAGKTSKDMNGDTPLAWASWHLRPAKILSLLCYGEHSIHPDRIHRAISDHGAGWGNGMEVCLLGKVHV